MRNERHEVPSPVFDPERLAAVEATGMVGSLPEGTFDRLASLAAEILDAPLAFVTAVDSERSWYKSLVGGPVDAQRWGPVEESFCQYVVGADTACFFSDAREDPVARHNPAVQRGEVVAWAGFPVRTAHGYVLGTLCVVDTKPREWTDRDRQVLETLAEAASAEVSLRVTLREERSQRARAEQATQQLERVNAELAETASRAEALATSLSANLLPPRLQSLEGLDVGARFRSAQAQMVTGDFYDVFTASRGRPAAVVGDVVGKGPTAATFASEVRYSVRAEATHSTRPAKVLTAVNRLLHAESSLEEQFATAVYASLRRVGRGWAVRLGLAGHPRPLVRRTDGRVEAVGKPGLPLGMFDSEDVSETQLVLEPGDSLLLYTDGIVEARCGGEEFGEERLREVLAETAASTAEAIVQRIVDAAVAFGGGSADDDMAALALVSV